MIALPFITTATRTDHRDDAIAVTRRYQDYRRVLRVASMSVPAATLRIPPVAAWARRSGVSVHTRSAAELDVALTAGIAPARITLHSTDDAALTQWGIRAGLGRFILGSQKQTEALKAMTTHTQRVLIDLSACTDPRLALRVTASRRLELIGVHHRLAPLPAEQDQQIVAAMIASLGCLRRHDGHIATRLSFGGLVPDDAVAPRTLRAAAELLESSVEDACARFRYPRPALVIQC